MMGKMEIRSPPGSRPRDGRHCDLCGCSQPAVRCDKCGCQIFCLSCDDMYHRHPKRRFHLRKAVDPISTVPQARPVLPVKVSQLDKTNPGDPSKMPLPPPRKKKTTSLFGSFRKPSPSSDNSPPLPKKEYSWTDRLGSIKKFMSNRPLPPLPNPDDFDVDQQPTTNGQSTRGDLTFIHKRTEDRPPQLPQRSPRTPEIPGVNQEKENRFSSSPGPMSTQMRNGALETNANHTNQNQEFPNNGNWNNQNGTHSFGTLQHQAHQRGFVPPGAPGYPGGMHQSSSATDLHSMHNVEGMPGAGPVPPHYPHYPMNPHMPPHYPYPMYPQYPNYPQYFGNSFANLSNPPTSEGDHSGSESASRHSSSKRHQFRKRAKRSQSVMMDRMAYPGQFFPFGAYPGYGPWGAPPMPMEAPPSPASSIRSLNRGGRSRRRKKMTSEDDDEDFSGLSSSPMSRTKSSSSDPKEQPRAPLANQTTSSDEESDDAPRRENKINTIRRQAEIEQTSSPVMEASNVSKLKKAASKLSDSDARNTPESRNEKRPSMDSNTESPQPASQKAPTPTVPTDIWECKHCTFMNPIGNKICQVCCKTASPRTETPVSVHSRPSSAVAATSSRKESVGSEMACSSPEQFHEVEEDTGKKDKQDMASLNSALDEAEKQISKGLEELMKLRDDTDTNISKEKPKQTSETQSQSETQENSKPVYKSSGRMRPSILDKLNLNKPQTSNAAVSTSTETQNGQSNWTSDKIIEARRHSNSSTTSDAYNSPLAQSPAMERGYLSNNQKRDSSCQTQQDSLVEYLEKKRAAEEAFQGRPVNNFGFGYGDRMDMVTSPVPSMYDRFYGGGYGMMQRSHSRASLFSGRMNDFAPMEYGGPGFGFGAAPMHRSVSRGSLTGDYPDGRMSEFHNLRRQDFYLSMEELVERRRQDNIRAQGLELVRMIREAEQQGFNADDIQVALTHCGKQNPMEWLQDNWRNMVDSVITLSTNYGNDKKENDIGLLSENEARDALRLNKGNIWAAVTECVEGRQRKYLELNTRGNFSRQEIVDSLTASDGDVEMAYAKLTKSSGKPFLMRIWGAGEGAQNQDGARPMSEDFHDHPRRLYKADSLNSDEMSEEIWSEDGEWEDEEYDGERTGDIEDLQTCHEDLQTCHEDLQTCHEDLQASHEDLQTNPQEMMTPESDRSDYCDPFPIDDRNASSPSDDIFFVIPEAKPEKKKGFLSKLAAFRRDSKEQDVLDFPKEEFASEQGMQPKEDTISEKSTSSSDQSKNNGALNALKNTFSAIKDTVTGGTKSDKKIPSTQLERRTIIVKGQLEHESLDSDSKDNVTLTSVEPLDESIPENQYKESKIKQSENLSKKDTSQINTDSQLSKIDENKSNVSIASSAESISKIGNKKSQSLAERLKFAKQKRSTTSNSSPSQENAITDEKPQETTSTKSNKEKVSLKEEGKDSAAIKIDMNKSSIREEYKSSQALATASNIINAQNETSTKHIETSTSSTSSPADVTNKLNEVNKTSLSVKTPSSAMLDTNQQKSQNQNKEESSSESKTISNDPFHTGTTRQNVSPVVGVSKKDTGGKDQSIKNEIKDTNKNSALLVSRSPEKLRDSDILKTTSSQIIPEVEKTGLKNEQPKISPISSENSAVEINSTVKKQGDLSEIVLKQDNSRISGESNKLEEATITHPETANKTDIPQTEMPVAFKNTKSQPGTSTDQTAVSAKQNDSLAEDEMKIEELKIGTEESQAIKKFHETTETVTIEKIVLTPEIYSSEENNARILEDIHESRAEMTENISRDTSKELEPKYSDAVESLQAGGMREQLEQETSRINIQKAEVLSENTSTIQLNESFPNLPAASLVPNIPEDKQRVDLEQPAIENFKDQNNSAIPLEAKYSAQIETSEIQKMSESDSKLNSDVTTTIKDATGQMAGTSKISALESESTESKEADVTSLHKTELNAESTQNTAGVYLKTDATPEILENKKEFSATFDTDSTKTGKSKGNKIGKIKKSQSQEKDKKEFNFQTKTTTASELENNTTTTNNTAKSDVLLSGEAMSKLIDNEKVVDGAPTEKITVNGQKSTDNVPEDELKVAANETNIQHAEESKLKNYATKVEPLDNIPENSALSTQSPSSIELPSTLPVTKPPIPSTSNVDQPEILEPQIKSENKSTNKSLEESNQTSSIVDNKTVSREEELQKPNISSQENIKINISSESAVSEFTNIPESSQEFAASNESVLDKSIIPLTTSDSTISENSERKITASTSDSSETTAAPSNTDFPDNSNTIASKSVFTSKDVPVSSTGSSSSMVPASSDNQALSSSEISKIGTEAITNDTKPLTIQEQTAQHSKANETIVTDIPTSVSNELPSPTSTVSLTEDSLLKRTVSEDSTSQAAESDDTEFQDSDESRPSSATPPNPFDVLRSRFEGLSGETTIRGGPMRPASPFRRMSFNSRKQVIALEKKRDNSTDKPWFNQKIINEPPKLPLPKRTLKQQLEMERKVRKMVSDRKIRTYRKAEIAVQLMGMNFEEEEAIHAANECSTLEQAISYLQQECSLCTGNFSVSQIVSMTHCEHRACRECIRAYFTVQIRDRTILDLLCPFCNEPDISDEDVASDYFNHLDIMLKKLVDTEIHELFQRKLRDRVLMKDPNFRWCSQCSSGFIAMPNLKRLICPDCNAITCASCRRLWEKEHEGISCEAFATLKDATDPEAQAAGLAKILTEDGIDCPSCHFRYALAKGGCMHFRCIQCQHDFCSGCSRPFKMGQKCGVSEFCAKLGLHAHHPRNCLFYLRDKEPEDLQKLLDIYDVKYNREPPDGMELKSTCQVMEQKETSDGMVDDYCGKEVQEGYAGLCRLHYVEYLGQLVNKNRVDPIQIFDNDDLELVLRRANIRLPPRRYRESDYHFRQKLVNLIEDELPLDKMDGS